MLSNIKSQFGEFMDEQLPETYQSLSFESDKESVEQLLTETLADPTHLYRGPTTEIRDGNIKFDSDQRPILEGDIPALAFRRGGWDGVIRSVRGALAESYDPSLGDLISMSDQSEMESPFIWTSTNANVGSSFGKQDLRRVLMVMKPSEDRIAINQGERGDLRKLAGAIKARKPYRVKEGSGEDTEFNELMQESSPPGFGDWDETLLGPYISMAEIRALISYDNSSSEKLETLIYSINRKLKKI